MYWPQNTVIVDDIEIRTESEEVIVEGVLIRREFRLVYQGVEKTVTQLHILNWDDHRHPEGDLGEKTIEMLIGLIDNYREGNIGCPVLVHCR
jgi:protein tyrosine phosphatase